MQVPVSEPRYGYDSLFGALEASLNALSPQLQTRCMQLAIFREDERISYDLLESLWGEDPIYTLEELQKWELIELYPKQSCVMLLDLHRDYLTCRGKHALADWHTMLLQRCTEEKISSGTTGYWNIDRLLHHLIGSNDSPYRDSIMPALLSLDFRGMDTLTVLPKLHGMILLDVLDLTGCYNLTEVVSLDGLPSLGTLDLRGCSKLPALPSMIHLKKLKYLRLGGCSELMGNLPNISAIYWKCDGSGGVCVDCINFKGPGYICGNKANRDPDAVLDPWLHRVRTGLKVEGLPQSDLAAWRFRKFNRFNLAAYRRVRNSGMLGIYPPYSQDSKGYPCDCCPDGTHRWPGMSDTNDASFHPGRQHIMQDYHFSSAWWEKCHGYDEEGALY